MGNFAQHTHPLTDSVKITIQRVNSSIIETLVASRELVLLPLKLYLKSQQMPYRSRFGSGSKNFTDLPTYRENNCRATNTTNGVNLYSNVSITDDVDTLGSAAFYQQQPPVSVRDTRHHALNVVMDGAPLSDIDLPEQLQPTLPPLNESYSVAQFYMLDDQTTGVLPLGSFSADNFTTFGSSLLTGLQELKARGVTRLIVDVVGCPCKPTAKSDLMYLHASD